jgi:hypothetical protein
MFESLLALLLGGLILNQSSVLDSILLLKEHANSESVLEDDIHVNCTWNPMCNMQTLVPSV